MSFHKTVANKIQLINLDARVEALGKMARMSLDLSKKWSTLA